MALPASAGAGAFVDVDGPVLPVVVAAELVLAGAESPPPPPQPATVKIRQANGTAASLMWMRFMNTPFFPAFFSYIEIRSLALTPTMRSI
ncbi:MULTISPECIES: hypothetical protein [Cupriavidus]|uniref:hypothetical protein n=1 Tax=Cupriavidus TaxID=106589 RepID=UPI001F0DBFEE|nr:MULTISPECIES: hypothetical protein [Cupriavidus]